MQVDITLSDEEKKALMALVMVLQTGTQGPIPPADILSVSPVSVSTDGITPITITGVGFNATTAVMVGGTALLSKVFVNATTITGIAPLSLAQGPQNVVVSDARGSDTLIGGVNYVFPNPPPPTGQSWQSADGEFALDFDRLASAGVFASKNRMWVQASGGGPIAVKVSRPALVTIAADKYIHGVMKNVRFCTAGQDGSTAYGHGYDYRWPNPNGGSTPYTPNATINGEVSHLNGGWISMVPGDQLVIYKSVLPVSLGGPNRIGGQAFGTGTLIERCLVVTCSDINLGDHAYLSPPYIRPPTGPYARVAPSVDPLLFPVSQINHSYLQSNVVSGTPVFDNPNGAYVKTLMGGPWITLTQFASEAPILDLAPCYSSYKYYPGSPPVLNLIAYGAYLASAYGGQALRMMTSSANKFGPPDYQLEELVQLGLEFYGARLDNGQWIPKAGQMQGRLFPILFSGKMLDFNPMLNVVVDEYNSTGDLPVVQYDATNVTWKPLVSGHRHVHRWSDHGHWFICTESELPTQVGRECTFGGTGYPILGQRSIYGIMQGGAGLDVLMREDELLYGSQSHLIPPITTPYDSTLICTFIESLPPDAYNPNYTGGGPVNGQNRPGTDNDALYKSSLYANIALKGLMEGAICCALMGLQDKYDPRPRRPMFEWYRNYKTSSNQAYLDAMPALGWTGPQIANMIHLGGNVIPPATQPQGFGGNAWLNAIWTIVEPTF